MTENVILHEKIESRVAYSFGDFDETFQKVLELFVDFDIKFINDLA